MALNQTAYFPNPTSVYTKTLGYSGTSTILQTLHTAVAARAVRLKNITVTITGVGGAATDSATVQVKFGSAYFRVNLNFTSTTVHTSIIFKESDLGAKDLWLLDTETVTCQMIFGSGAPTATYAVAIGIEDYMA